MTHNSNKKFYESIIFSGMVHLIIFIICIIRFPFLVKDSPKNHNIVTFEVVSIKDVNNIKNSPQHPNSSIKNTKSSKSKLVKNTKINLKKKTIAPSKKSNSQSTIGKNTSQATAHQKIKPIKSTTAPIKVSTKKKKITPKKKKTIVKKSKKTKTNQNKPEAIANKNNDSIDAILKNLEKASIGQDINTKNKNHINQNQNKHTSKSKNYNSAAPLSITEKLLIQQQIEKHWRKPAGVYNPGEIQLDIIINVEKNGVIKNIQLNRTKCPSNMNSICKLMDKSVLRAIRQANPLHNLSPKRYNSWKKLHLILDPSN